MRTILLKENNKITIQLHPEDDLELNMLSMFDNTVSFDLKNMNISGEESVFYEISKTIEIPTNSDSRIKKFFKKIFS